MCTCACAFSRTRIRVQVVVVVGNSLSGQDISMELVNVAKEIHLSSKSLNVSEGLSKVISKHDNLYLHPTVRSIYSLHDHFLQKKHVLESLTRDVMITLQIQCLHEDGRVVFVDGSWLTADTIIYCTG